MVSPFILFGKEVVVDLMSPFIRTSARVMAILQLCVAFSTFLWIVSGPFLGEYVRSKSSALLFQAVMGNQEVPGRSARNWERYQQFSEHRRTGIERAYANLEEHMQRSFTSKCREVLRVLFFGISPLTQIWLILSISLPIMLLRRSEGAVAAVWLIPAVAFAFALDNHWHGKIADGREAALFPTEAQLSGDLELSDAWHHYLADHWAATDEVGFVNRLESGEHAFNAAWLEVRLQTVPLGHNAKRSPFVLALYVLWNACFALVVWQSLRKQAVHAHYPA